MFEKVKKIINKNGEIIRYIIVGGLTTFASLLSYYICIWLFLDPDNGIQLQIANIISWILSVTFAYFANRKYVFKSNGKVIEEAVGFYGARILTLLIDMFSMFLMVTLFHINDKIAKIIVQFIILVLNYIFSKYLVFNDKNKKFDLKTFLSEKKHLIITMLGIFIFTMLFPYSGDDWQWSVGKLSIERIVGFSTNASLNGRYLGNTIVILLTKNRIIRATIMSLTLTFIINIIKTKEKSHYLTVILLLLLMPKDVFKQGIVWSSGFANYAFSILLLLIALNMVQKLFADTKFNTKLIIPSILVFYLSSLVIENLTIFLFLFLVILNIVYLIKNKKVNFNLLISLSSSLLGLLTMFTHPSYFGVLSGEDGYRTISGINEIFYNAIRNFTEIIFPNSITNNLILFIILTIFMITYVYKNSSKKKNNKLMYTSLCFHVICLLYFIIVKYNPDWMPLLKYSKIFNFGVSILFIINLFVVLYLVYKSKAYNSLLICGVVIGMVAPLFVVSPLGPRNFLLIYVLEVLLVLDVYRISDFTLDYNKLKYLICIIIFVIVGYYVSIYGYITLISIRRDNYVKEQVTSNNIENNILYVPNIPYEEYVWVPNPSNEYYKSIYKYIFNVPSEVNLEFIDYKIWYEFYYKND